MQNIVDLITLSFSWSVEVVSRSITKGKNAFTISQYIIFKLVVLPDKQSETRNISLIVEDPEMINVLL